MVFVLGTFLVVVAIVVGLYWAFVVRPEDQERRALRKRLRSGAARKMRLDLVRDLERLSSVDALNKALARAGSSLGPLQRLLDHSGSGLTVSVFLLASGCLALAVFVALSWVTRSLAMPALAGLVAGMLPYAYLRRRAAQRMQKFEEQFPEGIDLISRALRAGHGFTTGLAMVGEELPGPVGAEFRTLYDQQNFGLPLPDALRNFAARVPLIDARFFVTAVLTQREAGGNLAEVLDNLAAVMRERFRVKRQVRVLSAHGRLTGWVLALLPPALAVAFLIIGPQHIKLLVSDPLGVRMIIAALCLQVLGTLIIRKIVRIEY